MSYLFYIELSDVIVAGADMTGLQTRRKSAYYIHQVVGQYLRRGFARLELLVWKKFILGWEIMLLHKDELAMLRSLWRKVRKKPSTLLYDKKGDCEELHEWLEEQGVRSIAPVRKGARRGRIRRKLMKNFPQKTYNKRNRNENVNYVFENRKKSRDSNKDCKLQSLGKTKSLASRLFSDTD